MASYCINIQVLLLVNLVCSFDACLDGLILSLMLMELNIDYEMMVCSNNYYHCFLVVAVAVMWKL